MHSVQFAPRIARVHRHSRGKPKDGSHGAELHRNNGDAGGYVLERAPGGPHVDSQPNHSFSGRVDPCDTLQSLGRLCKGHHQAIDFVGIRPPDITEARLPLIFRKKVTQRFKKASRHQKVNMGWRLKDGLRGRIDSSFDELLQRAVGDCLHHVTKRFAPARLSHSVFEAHLMDILRRRNVHKLREHVLEVFTCSFEQPVHTVLTGVKRDARKFRNGV